MLTVTTELRRYTFWFRVYGTNQNKTSVYKFLDELLEDEATQKKLDSILRAISTNPMGYSHETKFKHLEEDVWEIKIHQVRIACLWDKKPDNLIAIYGFIKKKDKWPKKEIVKMRNEKATYLAARVIRVEGDKDGGIRQISCK